MGSSATDIAILAAHALELAPLRAAFHEADAARVSGLQVQTTVVGVGALQAAVGSARALGQLSPRAVVLLGSYGVYPGRTQAIDDQRLELFCPDELRLLDAGVSAAEAAFPPPMATTLACDATLTRSLAEATSAVRGRLATTLAITSDDGLAFRLARSGCHGENLEALAVGLACSEAGVPFTALLACTNEVGSLGRAQWASHHQRAAQACCDAALRWLQTTAAGVLSMLPERSLAPSS